MILFCICGFTKNNIGSDKQINAQNSKKVAILIIRVGNTQAFSPMTCISLKTDYAIRVPKLGTDVFIEDEKRLLESVPTYPKYTGNTNEYYIEYFKNIKPAATLVEVNSLIDPQLLVEIEATAIITE